MSRNMYKCVGDDAWVRGGYLHISEIGCDEDAE